jgi:hypothetical protein
MAITNHTLRHFNLDIDKGGHTTVTAANANAIAKSLQSLGLNNSNTKYSYICGDSGGGASVQSLHPQLVEIDVMAEGSGFMKCLLHALNLAYKTGSKDSLGDQGMNKFTTYQMLYLAILLWLTIIK